LEATKKFAASRLKDFKMKISTYYPSKAKRLDNLSNRAMALPVKLVFLLKMNEEEEPKYSVALKRSFDTEDILYYREFSKNTEAKYRIHPTELRMEFYINLLERFCVKGENVIGVYTRAKFMIAAKVSCFFILKIIFESKMSIGLRLLSLGRR